MPNTNSETPEGEIEIDMATSADAQADTPQETPAEETTVDTVEDQLAAMTAEAATLKDQLLRAMAETENLRRRAAREKEDAAKYAATGFARDLLSVGDNLRRALDSIPAGATDDDENLKNLMVGVEMTEREMLSAFEKNGIKVIDALGQKFDPNLHQAMFEVNDPDVVSGTVVQQIQMGYELRGRLLRPAMVGIAKGGPKEALAEDAPNDDTPSGDSPADTDPYGKPAESETGAKVDTKT